MKIYQFDKTKFEVRDLRLGKHSERNKKLRRKIYQQHYRKIIKNLEKE